MVALLLRAAFPVPDVQMLYLLSVMLVAAAFGRGPAVLNAALGVLAYDYFFVVPFFDLAVSDGRYFLTFAMMFGVGFVVSELTARLRHEEHQARTREARALALYELSRALGRALDSSEVERVLQVHAAKVFDAEVDLAQAPGSLHSAGPHQSADIRWSGQVAHVPLIVGERMLAVVRLSFHDKSPLIGDDSEGFVMAFCTQVAFALERVRLADDVRATALRARTEEMRSSLLATVSHDLRTPLGIIAGAASSLKAELNLAPQTRSELLDSIETQAARLERLVANLLDMTRLAAGAIVLRQDWVPLQEMVGSALTRLEPQLRERPFVFDAEEPLPPLYVDPVLFEQLLINLFENIAKYTPGHVAIEVHAHVEFDRVLVDVMDRGPGLPKGHEERVFDKFFRVASNGVAGSGLGLAICRGVAEVHGGELTALHREGGGALFRIRLPMRELPMRMSERAVGEP